MLSNSLKKPLLIAAFTGLITLSGCSESNSGSTEQQVVASLDAEQLSNLMQLPLDCAEVEYPNKLNQVLANAADLRSPKDLHPAFYGCFDWHSAVHGHWSMVRLMKELPTVEGHQQAKAILQRHITADNIAAELDYMRANPSWERPYGWAWLLKLMLELDTWQDPIAPQLTAALKPLADEIAAMYIGYLPKLVYPIRVGEHSNTAFGLTFAWDYSQQFNDLNLQKAIAQRATDYFGQDRDCPLQWEPSGYDFLSPCLEEIDLMRRVMPNDQFISWVNKFLPSLASPNFSLEVGLVSDRTDGKLVHLDGLNFSRAWVFYGLADQYQEFAHLRKIADQHMAYSLPNLVGDSYEGGHWLGSFAINALLR